ncbi:hypothetical protein IMG5_154520 [Ichthyophthirius multifiliis]|uniref:Transmembrane protein n=1 Tax=Ichthyophthirius multifiliis TaxID=5932 RepID=G0QZ55_ICHMU|nr:hypothetical protein IMG5_154520 [Ichthyophthirius multifiliis]EGR29506.1 hypothetical protein IMG5_154520 [Ichthyophthirius multifiliis]|eukprot:XP_004030742.1 hypothetical protein IMG5_154520 [Ichthyophthirius multifiliis]
MELQILSNKKLQKDILQKCLNQKMGRLKNITYYQKNEFEQKINKYKFLTRSSGNFIGQRGMRNAFKPNKEFGQKLYDFLSSQTQDLKVTLQIFFEFVEFFLQDQNSLKQNENYKNYSITELFCLISYFSEDIQNRNQDKEYINRLGFSYRQGLQFFKEMTLLFMKDQNLKFEDRNDAVPKILNNLIFHIQKKISTTKMNLGQRNQELMNNTEKKDMFLELNYLPVNKIKFKLYFRLCRISFNLKTLIQKRIHFFLIRMKLTLLLKIILLFYILILILLIILILKVKTDYLFLIINKKLNLTLMQLKYGFQTIPQLK